MDKKRVLFIGTGFHTIPPVKGAAVETWIYEVAKRLKKYEPYIISPSHPSLPIKENRDGVTYHRIHIGKLYTRLFKKITRLDLYSYEDRVIRLIYIVKPDIVHITNRYWIVPILRKKFNNAFKIILHMHNNFELKGSPNIDIDILAGCSDYMKNVAAKKIKINPEQTRVLNNGVDINRFEPVWADINKRQEMKKKLQIGEDNVILFVGRISPEKGVDTIIKAFQKIYEKMPDTKLVIVGEIRKGDRKGCEREEYGKMVMALAKPFGGNIIFTDLVNPSDIQNYYLIGDVFTALSVDEAFGSVFIEASACGLPIVATKTGGIPEAVKDGYSGILIDDPDNIDSIASTIISLLISKDKCMQMGKNGRTLVEKYFSWEIVAAQAEGLYDSLF